MNRARRSKIVCGVVLVALICLIVGTPIQPSINGAQLLFDGSLFPGTDFETTNYLGAATLSVAAPSTYLGEIEFDESLDQELHAHPIALVISETALSHAPGDSFGTDLVARITGQEISFEDDAAHSYLKAAHFDVSNNSVLTLDLLERDQTEATQQVVVTLNTGTSLPNGFGRFVIAVLYVPQSAYASADPGASLAEGSYPVMAFGVLSASAPVLQVQPSPTIVITRRTLQTASPTPRQIHTQSSPAARIALSPYIISSTSSSPTSSLPPPSPSSSPRSSGTVPSASASASPTGVALRYFAGLQRDPASFSEAELERIHLVGHSRAESILYSPVDVQFILGDLDSNGFLDERDRTLLLSLVQLQTSTPLEELTTLDGRAIADFCLDAADTNQDGAIDNTDIASFELLAEGARTLGVRTIYSAGTSIPGLHCRVRSSNIVATHTIQPGESAPMLLLGSLGTADFPVHVRVAQGDATLVQKDRHTYDIQAASTAEAGDVVIVAIDVLPSGLQAAGVIEVILHIAPPELRQIEPSISPTATPAPSQTPTPTPTPQTSPSPGPTYLTSTAPSCPFENDGCAALVVDHMYSVVERLLISYYDSVYVNLSARGCKMHAFVLNSSSWTPLPERKYIWHWEGLLPYREIEPKEDHDERVREWRDKVHRPKLREYVNTHADYLADVADGANEAFEFYFGHGSGKLDKTMTWKLGIPWADLTTYSPEEIEEEPTCGTLGGAAEANGFSQFREPMINMAYQSAFRSTCHRVVGELSCFGGLRPNGDAHANNVGGARACKRWSGREDVCLHAAFSSDFAFSPCSDRLYCNAYMIAPLMTDIVSGGLAALPVAAIQAQVIGGVAKQNMVPIYSGMARLYGDNGYQSCAAAVRQGRCVPCEKAKKAVIEEWRQRELGRIDSHGSGYTVQLGKGLGLDHKMKWDFAISGLEPPPPMDPRQSGQ